MGQAVLELANADPAEDLQALDRREQIAPLLAFDGRGLGVGQIEFSDRACGPTRLEPLGGETHAQRRTARHAGGVAQLRLDRFRPRLAEERAVVRVELGGALDQPRRHPHRAGRDGWMVRLRLDGKHGSKRGPRHQHGGTLDWAATGRERRSPYSYRNASTGSSRAARLAG